ncbi:penicillin-binding protein 2 [Conexibacter sp. SYSU D00693]|uniref:peptidoglycan D,D-transpeptidase FtsI family protein n=1 Tax=Conexibacter sp. SYSU D00693 TaxID=2812560 RepID=UPI00196A30AA|nr:penicillin-binding protein 2 [Conexibacter sp. SYSU D00693]
MNASISRLFVLVVVLFAVLIAFTSRWTVFEADALRDNAKNQRPLLETLQIRRGRIRADDGTLLARSVKEGRFYSRRYPAAGLFAHALGYSYARLGQIGLERERNDELTGKEDDLTTVVDQLLGKRAEGDNLQLTLDPGGQRVALQQLGGRKGSVVALDPRTGAVKVMASFPGYDPNELRQPGRSAELNTDQDAPLLNRATQSTYVPGSTMKVVTAIAAIDSGRFTPDSVVDGSNLREFSGTPLANFGGRDWGPVNLTTALTNSVNTAWASVAEKLGKETMQRYMERLGFGEDPPLDYPDAQMAPSGAYRGGKLIPATSRFVDIGRLAIGQDRLLVTPLQMAMVSAAVANGGTLMEPRLVDKVVDPDGRTKEELEPEEMGRVMSGASADAVRDMMGNVVREGSGTAAALEGIEVGGKTGTAEVRESCPNQVWFIGFAPLRNPRVAVAATIECTQGTGGEVAAPIAKAVMQELLG